jgi:hypothetical protein
MTKSSDLLYPPWCMLPTRTAKKASSAKQPSINLQPFSLLLDVPNILISKPRDHLRKTV